MIRIAGILVGMLFAMNGQAYRFVCNGYLANGDERSDDCGVCDDNHAARWNSPNIPVAIADAPLPPTITASDWQNIIDASFQAWEGIAGTSLNFVQLATENVREFGANDSIHEIFWITDRAEWRRLVGSGEFGTLGATLPRYSCEGEGGRTIFDADLVLNGLPHINWAVDCQSDDCISVQTTLVHELGHFFGLDHPCLMCSSSIMSARAGFDLVNPVFDDMEGLRVLYPAQHNTGAFGFRCNSDKDCADNNLCISDKENRYCSTNCSSDVDCEQGAICREIDARKMCTFVDGAAAGGRNEGENCMKSPCIEPLICAGAFEPNFFCFASCKDKSECKSEQDCIALDDTLSLCVGIKQQNDVCTHRELCEDHLYCVFETDDIGFCRAPCAPTTTAATGCKEGEHCQLLENRVEICMPLAGNLILDETSAGFGTPQKNTKVSKNRDEEQPMSCSHNDTLSTGLLLMTAIFLLIMRTRRLNARKTARIFFDNRAKFR